MKTKLIETADQLVEWTRSFRDDIVAPAMKKPRESNPPAALYHELKTYSIDLTVGESASSFALTYSMILLTVAFLSRRESNTLLRLFPAKL